MARRSSTARIADLEQKARRAQAQARLIRLRPMQKAERVLRECAELLPEEEAGILRSAAEIIAQRLAQAAVP